MLHQCPLVTGERSENEEIHEISKSPKDAENTQCFPPCTLSQGKRKVMNAVLRTGTLPVICRQVVRWVAATPSVRQARECEHDRWHPENTLEKASLSRLSIPNTKKPKFQMVQKLKHFESQHRPSSGKIHTLPWLRWSEPKIET